MKQRTLSCALSFLTAACGDATEVGHDAGETSGQDTGETSGQDTGETSGGESDGRTLSFVDDFQLCLVSPHRFGPEYSELFRQRGILTPSFEGVRSVMLENSTTETQADPLPFRFEPMDGDAIEITAPAAQALIRLSSIPDSIHDFSESPETDTVRYRVGGVTFIVSAPRGGEDFSVEDIPDLDSRGRLLATLRLSSNEGETASGSVKFGGLLAPCNPSIDTVDRLHVVFDGGEATFHTRPALWGIIGGFTTFAELRIGDVVLTENRYRNLDYWSGNSTKTYGVHPVLAMRLPEPIDGACTFVLETELEDLQSEGSWVPRMLDCEGKELRRYVVHDSVLVPGGGEPQSEAFLNR